MSKLFLFLAAAAGAVVGDPGGDVLARAGDRADDRADHRRSDDQLEVVAEHAEALLDIAEQVANRHVLHVCDRVGLRIGQRSKRLGQAEQADHGRDKRDARLEPGDAEGKARAAVDAVDADAGDQQSGDTGNEALIGALGRHTAADDDTEHTQPEELPIADEHGCLGDGVGKEHEDAKADHTACRGGRGDHDASADALTLLGQWESLERRRRRGGRARHIEQDCTARASVDTAEEHADHHDQRVRRTETQRGGNKQGNAHGGRQAGQRADDDTGKR